MIRYIAKRLAIALPTLVGITIVTFCIIQLAPGDPAAGRGDEASPETFAGPISPEMVERTRRLYGLDKPLLVNLDVWDAEHSDYGGPGFFRCCKATFSEAQYPVWLARIATLDFGTSYHDNRPVATRIGEALPVTLLFQAAAILLIYLIALPLGVLSALKRGTLLDGVLSTGLFLLYSLPNFWVATLLILFLAGGEFLDIFPPEGLSSAGADSFGPAEWFVDRLWHMILPVLCLTYGGLASLSRYARSGMLDVIRQDYIRTARAKGLPEWKVIGKHALRNGMIPIVTLVANIFPALIGGSVIVESIFNIPGMGRLLYSSFLYRDYPVIMAVAVLSSALVLLGMILSDLLYRLVDPRISLEERHG